jgi:thiol-disulfide isomerase/thioredoxin
MKTTIILTALFVLCGCYSRTPAVKTGLEGKPMPAIELIAADSVTHFNTKDIPVGKPTVLFSFEPWCPYCRAQTKTLLNNLTSLKDVNIYMICNSTYAEFKNYYDLFKLKKYPAIAAGTDNHHAFQEYFQSSKIPYLAIYDKDKNLKQALIGKNYISTIKEIISE